MSKPKQTPPSATSRADQKIVRLPHVQHSDKPSWRFSTVDKEGPFAWPTSAEMENKILQKLRQFDSMRWREIEGADHHAIDVDKLSKDAQSRLVAIRLDDLDEIFSFHYTGKSRIIGIRDRDVVKLLWWDPEHKVCLSVKKNT